MIDNLKTENRRCFLRNNYNKSNSGKIKLDKRCEGLVSER